MTTDNGQQAPPRWAVWTERIRIDRTRVLLATISVLTLFVGPSAAQQGAPTGGGGGDTTGWETILSNLYQVVYDTLQYAGLIVLVAGLIVWLTAQSNSQRSERGMKLTLGGGAMIIAYFGLGAVIALLEFIAG